MPFWSFLGKKFSWNGSTCPQQAQIKLKWVSVDNTDSQGSRQVSHRSLTALPYFNKKTVKATKMKRIKSRNKALANPVFIAHTVHSDLLMRVGKMVEMNILKIVSIDTYIKTQDSEWLTETHGDLWRLMETYGDLFWLWETLRDSERLWETYGDSWRL